ncbi:MAG TPA: HD domain-containing phosphohydrolase [Armatimonadota bacterium]|nr:HD domain-containing phosphohydrolase [Armatimonadota bacterium]
MSEPVRARVLVVDDDASVRSLLAQVLADAGCVVECAADGAAALGALRRSAFALAMVDLRLPGMSGTELAAAIADNWPDTAVIIATGVDSVATAVGCLRSGVYDYLTKPFDIADVAVRVQRALQRRRVILENHRRQQQLRVSVGRETRSARRTFLGAINSLSSALEAKDDSTRGHSERVSRIASEIARAIDARPEDVRRIRLGGRLHDIGKIGVRESVLLKPGKLTEEEWRQVQVHPVIGERILGPILLDSQTVRMVRHHHERYGGGGYPDRLVGSSIPLGSRVLAVADAFDALTSDRPYRRRLSPEGALAVLRDGAGQQWQPTLVEALGQRLDLIRPIVWRGSDREHRETGEALHEQGQDEVPDSGYGEDT